MSAIADWTRGEDGIAFQRCNACGHVQYFRRGFCAACGATDLSDESSRGQGTVYAVTTVHRAATEQTRAHVPYAIVLVDMAEGFRVMAHGDIALQIGDDVTARLHDFVGKHVPYFEKG